MIFRCSTVTADHSHYLVLLACFARSLIKPLTFENKTIVVSEALWKISYCAAIEELAFVSLGEDAIASDADNVFYCS